MLPRYRSLRPQRPRRKKSKKPAKSPIITPRYTRRHFEELNHNIMMFTQQIQHDNRRKWGRELERDEVDQQWTRLIQGIYPADDPKSYELLAQVECPMYDGYWEKCADEKAFFEREQRFELCAFTKSRWNPTQAQKRNWPGCVLLEDNGRKEILIPRIALLALQQINYMDFVKSVLQANPLKKISRFTMEELWVAVVTKIYHFEDALDKELKIGETNECTPATYRALAEDYRSAYEAAKARVEAKRTLQEDKKRERENTASEEKEDDNRDDRVEEEELGNHDRDQDDRAGKRQKTRDARDQPELVGNEKENIAQHLGAEQEDVGAFRFDEAAWQDLGGEQGTSAIFRFADTGLALRFKG
ncbi:MAG: hypothetical protein ASARMPRED_008953 [Alectoria sarmentosa]|nr:MAG: hypothetical protein ASARMPRED_008953 [Alectoria sarmentosa]